MGEERGTREKRWKLGWREGRKQWREERRVQRGGVERREGLRFFFNKRNINWINKNIKNFVKKNIKFQLSTPRHLIYTVRCWQLALGGCAKESSFCKGESPSFFYRGVHQKTPKLQGGKSHLTLNFSFSLCFYCARFKLDHACSYAFFNWLI